MIASVNWKSEDCLPESLPTKASTEQVETTQKHISHLEEECHSMKIFIFVFRLLGYYQMKYLSSRNKKSDF